jgi:hypothetical protein
MIKLTEIPAHQLTPEQREQARANVLATIEGATNQKLWAEAFAAFCDSFNVEFVAEGKQLTIRQLSRLIKSLPQAVRDMGEITAKDAGIGRGWYDFTFTPKAGIVFPLRNDFTVYKQGQFNENPVARAAKDARSFIENLTKIIESNTAYLERLDNDLALYNEAAQHLADAQRLLNMIAQPFNLSYELREQMPLLTYLKERY